MSTPIDVLLRSDVEAIDWHDRWVRGEVPGSVPYGLDRLVQSHPSSRISSLPDGISGAVLVQSLKSRLSASKSTHLAVSWDEESLLRAWSLTPARNLATGVIWATDTVARGEVDPKLRLVREVLRRCAAIWVLSSAQVEPLQEWLGKRARPAVVHIPFGIDADFFSPIRSVREPLIVSVGNDRDRDPELLMEIIEKLREREPLVQAIVQSRRIHTAPSGVRLVKTLTPVQLRGLYARASINLVATRPNLHVSGMTSALESMAMQTPTVATYSPGFEGYITDGNSGLFIDREDTTKAATDIIKLLKDRAHLEMLGRLGRSKVLNYHTEAHFNNGLSEQLTHAVIGGHV